MTVAELIAELNKVEDKDVEVFPKVSHDDLIAWIYAVEDEGDYINLFIKIE